MTFAQIKIQFLITCLMKDLQNPKLIYLKGFLFLALGLAGAVLLWLESPAWKTVLLLALAVWSFCRAYYFAFYVIEHYMDPWFRVSRALRSFSATWLSEETARIDSGRPFRNSSQLKALTS